MTDDDFTRAARAAAERYVPAFTSNDYTPNGLTAIARLAHVEGWKAARDYLAAQKPDVQHLWRPGASPSAFCGDESARPWVPATREESLAMPVCALCHQRAMHESYSLWAAQDPTDAEAQAYLAAFSADLPPDTVWTPDTIARVKRGLRAARRYEEKQDG